MSTALNTASLTDMVMAGASIDEISGFLDGLTHSQRLDQVMGSPRAMQPKLWALAEGTDPLDLSYFVPDHVPEGTPVPHHGWNSLPIPGFGRRFQKPMFRPKGKKDELHGFNISPFGPLIGPGYFVHTPTHHEPSWPERGHTVVDYFKIPDGPVPDHWPRVVPNSRGLQFFVYHQTRDFMRRVSDHVTIGAAFKKGKALGAYFMLVREDV